MTKHLMACGRKKNSAQSACLHSVIRFSLFPDKSVMIGEPMNVKKIKLKTVYVSVPAHFGIIITYTA